MLLLFLSRLLQDSIDRLQTIQSSPTGFQLEQRDESVSLLFQHVYTGLQCVLEVPALLLATSLCTLGGGLQSSTWELKGREFAVEVWRSDVAEEIRSVESRPLSRAFNTSSHSNMKRSRFFWNWLSEITHISGNLTAFTQHETFHMKRNCLTNVSTTF